MCSRCPTRTISAGIASPPTRARPGSGTTSARRSTRGSAWATWTATATWTWCDRTSGSRMPTARALAGRSTRTSPSAIRTRPYPLATLRVLDMDRDGDNDLVMTENEIKAGRIAWLENADGRGGSWSWHDLPPGDAAARGAYHSLAVADFDNDGDADVFTCEMEGIAGDRPPRWFIWENTDGKGGQVRRTRRPRRQPGRPRSRGRRLRQRRRPGPGQQTLASAAKTTPTTAATTSTTWRTC